MMSRWTECDAKIIFWYKEQGNFYQAFFSVEQPVSLGGLPLKEMVTLRTGLCNQSTTGFAEGASHSGLQLLGGKA